MKAATLNELQKELIELPPQKLIGLTTRLAKYKKENKELLTYLLFEAHDEAAFVKKIKEETEAEFSSMNRSNLYLAKKSLRKILRTINKFIRYSGLKETEVELRMHYCAQLKKSGIPFQKSQVLENLYQNQLKKIEDALSGLHGDLQFDFGKEFEKLT